MATLKARFKWTDDKLIDLINFLQESDSSYAKHTGMHTYIPIYIYMYACMYTKIQL